MCEESSMAMCICFILYLYTSIYQFPLNGGENYYLPCVLALVLLCYATLPYNTERITQRYAMLRPRAIMLLLDTEQITQVGKVSRILWLKVLTEIFYLALP